MPIETPRQLGALLRDGRRKAGFTQQQLAERIGASLRWVQRAERGFPGTGMGMLLRALSAVEVSLESGRLDASPDIVVPDVGRIIAAAANRTRGRESVDAD